MLALLASTFITVFLAELGDKTQLAIVSISGTTNRPGAVFAGSATALVLASLVGLRRSHLEAAMSLGATEARALWDVAVPAARSGIVAGAAMAFVLSFDEVAVSLFLSDAFTQTLPIALVAEMRANLNLTVAAVSTVFLGATLLLLLVLDRTLGIERLAGDVAARG
jgi:ABC-type spermidine/putrescine transport system permease subunit II